MPYRKIISNFAAVNRASFFRAFCKTKGFTIGKLNLYVPMLFGDNIGIFRLVILYLFYAMAFLLFIFRLPTMNSLIDFIFWQTSINILESFHPFNGSLTINDAVL